MRTSFLLCVCNFLDKLKRQTAGDNRTEYKIFPGTRVRLGGILELYYAVRTRQLSVPITMSRISVIYTQKNNCDLSAQNESHVVYVQVEKMGNMHDMG